MIDVVFAALADGEYDGTSDAHLFADGAEAFGHDDYFVPWDVVVFDGFADDFFGSAVGVDVGGVPLFTLS